MSRDDAAWQPSPGSATDAPSLTGYRDLVPLIRGGESVLYRGRQQSVDRDVAIKVLKVGDPGTQQRFNREIELTANLGRQHPNIVTVLDTGRLDTGEPCIVMELHELGSLQDRLEQHGPLDVDEVVAAGTAVADALAFAHARGVLHRDVKPQNVLLLPTSYVLADFGIARPVDAGHTDSVERFSYRHAAPQVLDGYPPAAADDLWSLGSTLYTLLDGRAPFASLDPDDDSALSYIRRARTESPRPLRRDDLPDELTGIVARALAPERDQRFLSAGDLRDALAAVPTETRSWAPDRAAPPAVAVGRGAERPASSAPAEPDPGRSLAEELVQVAPPPPEAPPRPVHEGTASFRPPPRQPQAHADSDMAEGATSRPKPRLVAFAAVALVVGIALSLAIALANREPTEPDEVAGDAPVPELPDEVEATEVEPDSDDPQLAPDGLTIDDRGTSAVLRWDEETDGVAQFVVVQTQPEPATAVLQLPAGMTQASVEGLDPDEARYCYRVLAVTADGSGPSDERCIDRDVDDGAAGD